MKKPIISVISAISENRAIGKDNKLLWHIPEDLQRFKSITKGHPVIMGRITYESMGRLLPQRLNIIITRDKRYKVDGAVIVSSLDDAIDEAKKENNNEIFVIGGGQIYSQAIGIADKLYLTIVHKEIDGDTFFPDYSKFRNIVFKKKSESEGYKYTFLDLVK